MERRPKGARYEVYTHPDLYPARPWKGGWALRLLIGLALLAVVVALGVQLYLLLAGTAGSVS